MLFNTLTSYPKVLNKQNEGGKFEDGFSTDDYSKHTKRNETNKIDNVKDIQKNDKIFHCDTCEKSFHRKGNMIIHKRIHSGEKSFHCNICSRSFSTICKLKDHIRRIHENNEHLEKCDLCDKTFPNKWRLKVHKITHDDKRNYKCDSCDKVMQQKKDLTPHQSMTVG